MNIDFLPIDSRPKGFRLQPVLVAAPPRCATSSGVGFACGQKGDWDGAIAECREALRLKSKDEFVVTHLGAALLPKRISLPGQLTRDG